MQTGPVYLLPEMYDLKVTAAHLAAIEYLSKTATDDFRADFCRDRKCWYCHQPIDPDEPQDGHETDCLYLACCELAQMTDSE